jgi:small subunit ribosomal protein S21
VKPKRPGITLETAIADGLFRVILLHARTKDGGEVARSAHGAGGPSQPKVNLTEEVCCVQVLVRDNNVDQALKALKKKMQREGIFREMKLRGHYEKPSEKKAREKAEAIRRARKLARKRMQREGLLPMKPKPTVGGPGGGRTGAPRRPSF